MTVCRSGEGTQECGGGWRIKGDSNLKWLHKPIAILSDEDLLHDDLLHLLLTQHLLCVGVCSHDETMRH